MERQQVSPWFTTRGPCCPFRLVTELMSILSEYSQWTRCLGFISLICCILSFETSITLHWRMCVMCLFVSSCGSAQRRPQEEDRMETRLLDVCRKSRLSPELKCYSRNVREQNRRTERRSTPPTVWSKRRRTDMLFRWVQTAKQVYGHTSVVFWTKLWSLKFHTFVFGLSVYWFGFMLLFWVNIRKKKLSI